MFSSCSCKNTLSLRKHYQQYKQLSKFSSDCFISFHWLTFFSFISCSSSFINFSEDKPVLAGFCWHTFFFDLIQFASMCSQFTLLFVHTRGCSLSHTIPATLFCSQLSYPISNAYGLPDPYVPSRLISGCFEHIRCFQLSCSYFRSISWNLSFRLSISKKSWKRK